MDHHQALTRQQIVHASLSDRYQIMYDVLAALLKVRRVNQIIPGPKESEREREREKEK